jgi:chemotaxis protein MotB
MAISVPDASGVLVRPAGGRGTRGASRGESRAELRPRPQRGKRLATIVIGSALIIGIAGGVAAYLSTRGGDPSPRPAANLVPADEKARLERELFETREALATEKKEADELRAERAVLAEKAAEATKVQEKLAAVVSGQGQVTQNGDEITLELIDKVLFKVGEAELTPRGQAVLARVGEALNDVPDKQIWVQGHTDDTPIRITKGVEPRFATNWELASARALTVVHYLQGEAKVDPRRLAAVAFGEYRPASRSKAKNRRIEIVLYPKHQLAK